MSDVIPLDPNKPRRSRDDRIVDDTVIERSLQCAAAGCPHRWSVDAGKGKLCSAHAWSDPARWPHITQELVDARTEDTYRAQFAKPAQPAAPMTREQRRSIGERMREALQRMAGAGSRAWAQRLRAREEAGSRLTPAQREMWREALHAQHEQEQQQ